MLQLDVESESGLQVDVESESKGKLFFIDQFIRLCFTQIVKVKVD